MSGHVFVVRGDVVNIVCDWWVLPSGPHRRDGAYGEVRHGWVRADPGLAAFMDGDVLRHPPDRTRRAVVVREPEEDTPGVIAVNSGSESEDDAAWFGAALDAVGEVLPGARVRCHRHRPYPLVAFPPIGTGAGGGRRISARVLTALLNHARGVSRRGVDLVLVTPDGPTYSAAQRIRNAPQLGIEHEALASRLADEVRRGRLVPFIGAGVSQAGGLDSWAELLTALADTAGIRDPAQLERLGKMDVRDAALLIDRRLRRLRPASDVSTEIRRRYDRDHRPSLTHQLLASLPVTQAITTNYDRLFESAWSAANRGDGGTGLLVFPRDLGRRGDRWLAKIHGDIDDRDPGRELVLARDSYARLQHAGAAVTGVLHAMLMTSHLLIVGYGLTDETFHRVAHDIRGARPERLAAGASTGIATALVLGDRQLEHELWIEELDIAGFGPPTDGHEAYAVAAREQQIFLDRLAHLTAPVTPFVLDPRLGELSETGLAAELRGALSALRAAARGPDGDDPLLHREVEELLARFGGGL